VSFLKRLFGTTDAVQDARARAQDDEALVGASTSKLPSGWASPTTRDEGDTIVLEMPAPGLDPETVSVRAEGAKLRISAGGESADGREKLSLDESLSFPEGSDLSGATADYADDRLVVRIPKSGVRQTPSGA
jgi:HSP20 family molecular chaperone IbpA